MINKIDGKEYKRISSLSASLKKYKISLIDYFIKFENLEIPKCDCGKDRRFYRFSTEPIFRKTCGSKECLHKISTNYVTSEETKEKIRKSAFTNFLKKTGKTPWERRQKREYSTLENWFIGQCADHNLFNTFDIIYDFPVYPYFIDFAFINEKIAVELDGGLGLFDQHQV